MERFCIRRNTLVCRVINLINHKKTLAFFETNDTCNTCTQPIDQVFKQSKISSEKNKISELESGLINLLTEKGLIDLNVANDKRIKREHKLRGATIDLPNLPLPYPRGDNNESR